jgi:hypothetical protein
VTGKSASSLQIHLCPTEYARSGPRSLASFTYEVSAELERRSDSLSTSWEIVPFVRIGHILVELRAENDFKAASRMVNEALEALDLL